MQHVPPYTRPNRKDDIALVANHLHAVAQNGTYLLDGVDLNADDIDSRRFVVEALQAACRTLAERGRNGYWSYSLPAHHSLLRILHAEVAELQIRLNRTAAGVVRADQRRAAA